MADENNFTLESHGVTLSVRRINMPGHVIFRVEFSSRREPIVVARATSFNTNRFWTSIPEGRQKEAEGVGKLIEQYFESIKK